MNPLQDLRDVRAPETTVTVEGLLRSGRSRVRRRRAAITGAAAAAVLALTLGAAVFAGDRPPAPAPIHPGRTPSAAPSPSLMPQCRATDLPGDGVMEAPVIDATGRWAAALYTSSRKVAIWHDGVLVKVRDDVEVMRIAGISATGEVAVNALRPGGEQRAMTMNAEYSVLMTTTANVGPTTEANGINAGGDVVGTSGAIGFGVDGAVLWRKRDPGRPVRLAAPAGHVSVGLAVGEDGTVGGYVDDHKISRVPYLWRPDGTPVALRLPGGNANGSVDAIAGDWAVDFGNHTAWRLSDPGDPVPRTLVTGSGQPRALAADGAVVVRRGPGAVVVRDGLETALPLPADWSKYDVGGISADGRTVGGAVDGHPLRWICGE